MALAAEERSVTLTPEERYLFDLRGYLVLEDVLTEAEVGELNALLDEYDLWESKGTGRFDQIWSNDPSFITVGPVHAWDQPFRRLLDHPRLLPYLLELCGPFFRYDHGHALLMRKGAEHLVLHGGNTPFDPPQYYAFRDGKSYNGLVAVSWALTDSLLGQGGFAAIPGSHKANLPCPQRYIDFEDTDAIVHVPTRAGSVIIFTEALTHGTWPWKLDNERRGLLYKYAPGHIGIAGTENQDGAQRVGELDFGEWTEQQLRVLTLPSDSGRVPVLAPDPVTTTS
jgi:hypothetical protein